MQEVGLPFLSWLMLAVAGFGAVTIRREGGMVPHGREAWVSKSMTVSSCIFM